MDFLSFQRNFVLMVVCSVFFSTSSLGMNTDLETHPIRQNNNFHYGIVDIPTNWTEAFGSCRANRGELATPLNPSLEDDLRAYIIARNITQNFWIGGKASEDGTWHWETYNLQVIGNGSFANESCASPVPGHCISAYPAVDGSQWHWCGQPCIGEKLYVCEFLTEPTTTTMSTTLPPSTTATSTLTPTTPTTTLTSTIATTTTSTPAPTTTTLTPSPTTTLTSTTSTTIRTSVSTPTTTITTTTESSASEIKFLYFNLCAIFVLFLHPCLYGRM